MVRTIGISVAIIGLGLVTAFAIDKPEETVMVSEIEPKTEVKFCRPINEQLGYFVGIMNRRSLPIEKLENAKQLAQIIPNYPSSWINHYSSVIIKVENANGFSKKATGTNGLLTDEQLALLEEASVDSQVSVWVKYKSKNSITGNLEPAEMEVLMKVVPAQEAVFAGGNKAIMEYLNEGSSDEMVNYLREHIKSEKFALEMPKIMFTVSINGQVENVKRTGSYGDTQIDKMLEQLISEMPQWQAAQNSDGQAVTQSFEFKLGVLGC